MIRDFTKYLIRWRFEFHDGKRDKVGMWSQHSNTLAEMAAFVDKNNLAWAIIEAKDRETRQVIPLVEVPGQDYFNFSWIAEVDGISNIGLSSTQLQHGAAQIIGLKVTTRNEEISAFSNGEVVVKPLIGGTDSINLEQYRV